MIRKLYDKMRRWLLNSTIRHADRLHRDIAAAKDKGLDVDDIEHDVSAIALELGKLELQENERLQRKATSLLKRDF